MKKVKIYTLADPITNEIRYVGKTKYSLQDRLCKHMLTTENNYRGKWIRSILKKGLRPTIELIEEVHESIWIITEQYWISQFIAWGFRLVNSTIGGESGIISKQCREACIKANTNRKVSKLEILKKQNCNTCKRVLCIDKNNNQLEFKSASEAARVLDCCLSHITECCNNKRKTHKGYIFKYKD